jgi:WD40 repeat protein
MLDTTEALLARYEPQEVAQIVAEPQVNEARFSPCGCYLAAAGFDARVRLWNVSGPKPEEFPAIPGHNGWVHSVVFHPQEPIVYSADSWGQLMGTRLADQSWQPMWQRPQAHDGWIRQIDISSDGRLLASCAPDRRIGLWSALDGQPIAQWLGHDDDIQSLRFHPNGKHLATGDAKGQIKLWDVQSRELIRQFDAGPLWMLHRLQDVGGVRVIRFRGDGQQMACAGVKPANGGTVQGEPTLMVFDTESAELKTTLTFGVANDCFLQDVHWTEDGVLICVTSGTPGTGKIIMRRVEDDKPFFETTKIPNCLSVSLLPSAGRMAIVSTNRNSNGNGRRLNKEGEYEGNNSPILLFQLGKQA